MKNLLKIISTYTLINIFIGALSFVLMSVLTFYLSPNDYALIHLSNGFIRIFYIFIGFGTTHVLMTKLYDSSGQEKIKSSISSFLFFSFFISIVFAILSFFYSFWEEKLFGIPSMYLWIFPLAAYFTVVYEFIASLLIFKERTLNYTVLVILKFLIEIALIILLVIFIHYGWLGRVEAMVFSLIIIISIFIPYLKNNNFLSISISLKTYIADLKLGLPLIIVNISIFVFDISDRFFLQKMTNLYETGIYSSAYTYSSILLIIGTSITNAIKPRIYKQLSENNFQYQKLLTLNIVILLSISAMILLFNDFVFNHFINEKYKFAKSYTLPLVLGFLIWSINVFFSSFLMYYNKNQLIAFISIIGILLNLALNYIFILYFGAIGAAYATLFSCLISLILTYYFFIRQIKQLKST